MRVKDTIIISDLDGTIIPRSGKVSKRNIDAIARFKSLGGSFSIATGRVPLHAIDYARLLLVDTAFICSSGGVIYNIASDKIEWSACFDNKDEKLLKTVDMLIKTHPQVGFLMIDTDDRYHVINDSQNIRDFEKYINKKFAEVKYGTLPPNCPSGIIGVSNSEEMREISLMLTNLDTSGMRFTISGARDIDILPSEVSKGYSLERLVTEYYGKRLENTVTIGDYNNDIEMIEKAGLGVAVENACDDLKAVADKIVSSCENDGLAELIEYLIANDK